MVRPSVAFGSIADPQWSLTGSIILQTMTLMLTLPTEGVKDEDDERMTWRVMDDRQSEMSTRRVDSARRDESAFLAILTRRGEAS